MAAIAPLSLTPLDPNTKNNWGTPLVSKVNELVTAANTGTGTGGASTVRTYGAVGDGTTNDTAAFNTALTAAANSGTDKTVRVPAGTYYLKLSAAFTPAAGVTIQGAGSSQTVLLIDPTTPGVYTEAFGLTNNGVTLAGFTIRRATDFPSVLLPLRGSNITLRDVTVDGQRDSFTTNYCHGLQVGIAAASNLRVYGSTFTRLSYGLFQTNAATAAVDGLLFQDCTFTANTATDLEFNAPASAMTRVRVERCTFSNNTATAAGAGFAVGLAHVVDVVIRDCTFTGTYNNEALHFEDYSQDVTVTGCKFTTGGLINGSVVQIISGCSRIRLTGNTFDSTGNTTTNYVINALAGGTGTTPGGRPTIAPFHLDIADNDFNLTGTVRGIYLEVVLYANITSNRFQGPGTISSGVYTGSFSYAIRGFFAYETRIIGNLIRKFNIGIFPASDGNQTFGKGSVIADNGFEQCLLGAGITNIDGVTVTGNTFNQCQYPAILGHGSYTNGNTIITDNHAVACTNPFGLYGMVTVTAAGAASTGSGVTLATASLPNVIPDGTIVTFTGGGTLTTTGAVSIDARSLTGTLTGAAIANAETGYAYIPYSYNGASNRTIANNSDDYWGAAGYGRRAATTSTNYRIAGHEEVVTATASVTVTLPPAAYYRGQSFTVKNRGGTTVTVAAAGGSVETTTLTNGASVRHTSDGTNWIAY